MITEEIKKQWAMPISQFQNEVKCCYNCEHYNRDDKQCILYDTHFLWDTCCTRYKGNAKIKNLLVELNTNERDLLSEQLGNGYFYKNPMDISIIQHKYYNVEEELKTIEIYIETYYYKNLTKKQQEQVLKEKNILNDYLDLLKIQLKEVQNEQSKNNN